MRKHGKEEMKMRQVLGVAVLFLSFLLIPPAAQARVGGLDPAFGEGGRVTTPIGLTAGIRPVIAGDGSILLRNERQIVRYLPNGTLDPGFGAAGQVLLPEQIEGLEFLPTDLAVDRQGRPVLFGLASDPTQRFVEPIGLWSVPATWSVVMRLERDGDLDPAFGEGKGYVRTDFGLRSELDPSLPLTYAALGHIDSMDRPILMVKVAERSAPCFVGKATYGWYPRAIVRLTGSGALDPAFGGGDGIGSIGGNWDYSGLELDAAGGAAAAVGTENCRLGGNRIFRLDSSGAFSTSFGANGGSRVYPGLYLSLLEPSGSLILDGRYKKTRVLARTRPDGRLDPVFGKKGRTALRMPFGTERTVRPVGVDARRRILLVGSFNLPKPKRHTAGKSHPPRKVKRRPLRSFLAVGRLTASGRPDVSFGKRGWIVTRFKRPRVLDALGALDPQGRLLVAVGSGSARQPAGPSRVVLARYLLGGP